MPTPGERGTAAFEAWWAAGGWAAVGIGEEASGAMAGADIIVAHRRHRSIARSVDSQEEPGSQRNPISCEDYHADRAGAPTRDEQQDVQCRTRDWVMNYHGPRRGLTLSGPPGRALGGEFDLTAARPVGQGAARGAPPHATRISLTHARGARGAGPVPYRCAAGGWGVVRACAE
eukprot:gene43616-35007_t